MWVGMNETEVTAKKAAARMVVTQHRVADGASNADLVPDDSSRLAGIGPGAAAAVNEFGREMSVNPVRRDGAGAPNKRMSGFLDSEREQFANRRIRIPQGRDVSLRLIHLKVK
jgi:hypothetical protein